MDEAGGVWMQAEGGNHGEEGGALDVAVGAQARGDAVEVAVVVAGVAAELEGDGLRRQGVEDGVQRGLVEIAGGGDADGSAGGEDARAADLGLAVEAGVKAPEEADLEAAQGAAAVERGERDAPGLLEGVADGADACAFGGAEQRARNGGEEVGVFVRVEVRDADAGGLQFGDLGEGFALDLVFVDVAAQEGLREVEEGGAEGGAIAAEERGDGFGWGDGVAVGEDDVAADAECGVGVGDGDGVVEGGAGGHEGCGGEGAGLMEFGDGAVDAWGEAEVVRVDDEAGSHVGWRRGRWAEGFGGQ